MRLVDHQELVVGRLLNLDEVRHLRDFLDVSEELANPFATGECLLRHRGLSFRRPEGANLPKRDCRRPRVEFRIDFEGRKPNFRASSPEFVLQTFKTQNDARGAWIAPARQNHLFTDCKSPKLPISQRLTRGKRRRPHRQPRFRAAVPIWGGNRGDSRVIPASIPTHFRVRRAQGIPFARPLLGSTLNRPGLRLACSDGSRVSLRSPGISLK